MRLGGNQSPHDSGNGASVLEIIMNEQKTARDAAKIHKLKSWPDYFHAVKIGVKTFEIRKNDRDFQVGDTLRLCEYDDDEMVFSGDELDRQVTYITQGVFGLPDDVCIMGIAEAERDERVVALVAAVETIRNMDVYLIDVNVGSDGITKGFLRTKLETAIGYAKTALESYRGEQGE